MSVEYRRVGALHSTISASGPSASIRRARRAFRSSLSSLARTDATARTTAPAIVSPRRCRDIIPSPPALVRHILLGFTSPPPPPSSQGLHDAVRFESLAGQVAIEPLKLPVVRNRLAVAQPLLQRRFEQRIVVDRIEHFVHGAFCHGLRDTGTFDLHPDAHLA